MRTRFWSSRSGTTTCLQLRDDSDPPLWLHCNIGWVPLGNAKGLSYDAATPLAEQVAKGYDLEEADEETALEMAGGD